MIKNDKLKLQVEREYNMWFNHIRDIREYKRDILSKVLDPNLPQWQVRVNLLWKNIQLENALFLTDNLDIEFLSSKWVLWDEIMKNANLVAKYDYEDMELIDMNEDIVNYNWLYWLTWKNSILNHLAFIQSHSFLKRGCILNKKIIVNTAKYILNILT